MSTGPLPQRWFWNAARSCYEERGPKYGDIRKTRPCGFEVDRGEGFSLTELAKSLNLYKRQVRQILEALDIDIGRKRSTRLITKQEAERVTAEHFRRRGAIAQLRALRERRRLARGTSPKPDAEPDPQA